jgi:hypothetical protein
MTIIQKTVQEIVVRNTTPFRSPGNRSLLQ